MENESNPAPAAGELLRAAQVYTLAGVCLVVGLAAGYLSRGSLPAAAPPQRVAKATGTAPVQAMAGGHTPSLMDMKRMADKQAAPLLEKLKSNPNDSALLLQVGAIYHTTHQFKDAAAYYSKAMQIDPKNVVIRTKLASSLYRTGDVDGAIAQLNEALRYEPNDANSLFNLGMIKLQGKGDGKGAVGAWQLLLKSNPQLSPDRKAEVQKLLAEVLTTLGDQRGKQGVRKP